jgi:hypothetical protein
MNQSLAANKQTHPSNPPKANKSVHRNKKNQVFIKNTP